MPHAKRTGQVLLLLPLTTLTIINFIHYRYVVSDLLQHLILKQIFFCPGMDDVLPNHSPYIPRIMKVSRKYLMTKSL